MVYTYVPGNLTELIRAFDLLPVLPEINALQSAMRKRSGDFVREAEKFGHSEDVCTYVKCDIGMLKKGNIGPTGDTLPPPDLLLLSYTGCFTFMKWFELLQQEYDCPVVMLHVPYQAEGHYTPEMVDYIVNQLKDKVIPALEQVSGKYDEAEVARRLELSSVAEDDLVHVLQSAKHTPSPIDGYFGGVFYIGPIFSAFRGTEEGVEYYRLLRDEIDERVAAGLGPITPDGTLEEERYRLVVEGRPTGPTSASSGRCSTTRERWCVASAPTPRSAGLRHRLSATTPSSRSLETLAEYCLGCYTNLNLPAHRLDLRNTSRRLRRRRLPDQLGEVAATRSRRGSW